LLVHDLLLAKRGIAASSTHALRLAVERHKARLQAEFTKARLRKGCSSIEALREYVESIAVESETIQATSDRAGIEDEINSQKRWPHPRWVRINGLKTNLKQQLQTTFAGYQIVNTLEEVLEAKPNSSSGKRLHIDTHIPDLVALPPASDLSTLPAYKSGLIILQDKASCFPAYLLNIQPNDADVLDACAAPGNKTTHLAALIHAHGSDKKARIWACERDKARAVILQKMITTAGVDSIVTIKAGQDFLRLNPDAPPWSSVGALLLDPSCSGSGIVGRDASHHIVLPSKEASLPQELPSKKKRKRKPASSPIPAKIDTAEAEETPLPDGDSEDNLRTRLTALSTFQTKLLQHAFRFPSARKVTYSTCSVYDAENEQVVLAALGSAVARDRGWKMLPRERQVAGMKAWDVRGNAGACGEGAAGLEIAEACLRCEKHTRAGTQGFFVAAFVRDVEPGVELRGGGLDVGEEEWEDEDVPDTGEEEWEGFGDP
jgi:putative methyltransferase